MLAESALPQGISASLYENEEDLEEGLLSGELSYQEYLELLELLREGVVITSPQMERLLFLPDFNQSDIELICDTILTPSLENNILSCYPAGSFFIPEFLAETRGRISFQTRQRFDKDYSYNFILTEFKSKNKFLLSLQLQKEDTSSPVIRKRSLELSNLFFLKRVVLGNFDKKIGLGLNIGYHPLLKTAEEIDENSFLYPLSGRYNGILIESKYDFFSPGLILSKNKRGVYSEELWALNLLFSFPDISFGLLRSEGRLKNSSNRSSFYDRNTGVYFKARKQKITLSGEYSFLNSRAKGLASILTIKDKLFSIELSGWSYTQDFLHIFGSGLSNPDNTAMEIDQVEYEYPSRETGESGFLFKSRYQLITNLHLDFSFSQWRECSDEPFKLKNKIGIEKIFSDNFKTRLEYYHSDSDLEEEGSSQNLISSRVLFKPHRDFLFRLITRYGEKELSSSPDRRKSFELQLRSDFHSISPFIINLWIRYRDTNLAEGGNGYWDFRIRERFSFYKNSYFWAEYFINLNHTAEDKVHGAKLRLEAGF